MKLYMCVYIVHLLASVSFLTTRCKSSDLKLLGHVFHNVWGVAALRYPKIQTWLYAQAAAVLEISMYLCTLKLFHVMQTSRRLCSLKLPPCKLRIQAFYSRIKVNAHLVLHTCSTLLTRRQNEQKSKTSWGVFSLEGLRIRVLLHALSAQLTRGPLAFIGCKTRQSVFV